jgi:hypothetical protein
VKEPGCFELLTDPSLPCSLSSVGCELHAGVALATPRSAGWIWVSSIYTGLASLGHNLPIYYTWDCRCAPLYWAC